MSNATLNVPDGGVKMLRETLCLAQHALSAGERSGAIGRVRQSDIERISALIRECDRHRPLGPNGKHGKRHTETCGCEDKEVAQHGHHENG